MKKDCLMNIVGCTFAYISNNLNFIAMSKFFFLPMLLLLALCSCGKKACYECTSSFFQTTQECCPDVPAPNANGVPNSTMSCKDYLEDAGYVCTKKKWFHLK